MRTKKLRYTTQLGRSGRVALPPCDFRIGQRVFVSVQNGALVITEHPKPYSEGRRMSLRIKRVNLAAKNVKPNRNTYRAGIGDA